MTERNYTGRSVCRISGLLGCIGLGFWAMASWAQPTAQLAVFEDIAVQAVLEGGTQAWTASIVIPEGAEQRSLDEQVFTDLSPLLDSPDAVRLPPDQSQED